MIDPKAASVATSMVALAGAVGSDVAPPAITNRIGWL
jgi:hypothetical protein